MLPSPDPDRWHHTTTSRHVAGTVLLLLNSVASIILLPSRPITSTILLLLVSPDPSLAPYCYCSSVQTHHQHHTATARQSRPAQHQQQRKAIADSPRRVFDVSKPDLSRSPFQTRHQSLASYCYPRTPVAGTVLPPPDLSLASYCYSRPVACIVLLPRHVACTVLLPRHVACIVLLPRHAACTVLLHPDLSLATYCYLPTCCWHRTATLTTLSLAPYCHLPDSLLSLPLPLPLSLSLSSSQLCLTRSATPQKGGTVTGLPATRATLDAQLSFYLSKLITSASSDHRINQRTYVYPQADIANLFLSKS